MEGNRRATDLQLTFIGVRHVGKTSLLRSYNSGRFDSSQLSDDQQRITITEDTVQDIQVDGISYLFRLRDTFLNSPDQYFTSERLFPLQCLNTTALVACYAVDDRASFMKLREFILLASHFLPPDTPRIIVATKIDLRDLTETNSCVSTAEGRAMSRQMNANAFVECSALSGQNLRQAFEEAAKAAVKHRSQIKEKKRCTIS
ncbi:ras-like GTP-binding protein RhoL isoform X1 [Daphnia pulicaria]|uniref:ras-like GTP-binding protein RhoL isoform X1 n=1 Tax=Daphnia pulicaria TaxID=35523 RepID=UPI001EECC126|nr:ras-like GTP-binding protein RhoL isoform X1 [Daphnia pulicaria]